MKIGDIRYRVFRDPKNQLWVGRVAVTKVTPKGRRITFKCIDGVGESVFTVNRNGLPSETKVEALQEYQHRQIPYDIFADNGVMDRGKRVKRIIEAQKLIDEITFCPSI